MHPSIDSRSERTWGGYSALPEKDQPPGVRKVLWGARDVPANEGGRHEKVSDGP